MKELLCNTSYLYVSLATLLLALLIQGAGKGIGSLLGPLLKRLGGQSGVTVNVGEKQEIPCLVDPSKCPAHGEEKQRSLKNEEGVKDLWTNVNALRKEVRDGTNRILLALVASGKIKPEHIPKEE